MSNKANKYRQKQITNHEQELAPEIPQVETTEDGAVIIPSNEPIKLSQPQKVKSVNIQRAPVEEIETEEQLLAKKLQPVVVRLSKEGVEDTIVTTALKKAIDEHFDYLLGVKGFAGKTAQTEQVVTFANRVVRLSKLPDSEYYLIMDHLLTKLRSNKDKLDSGVLLRLNIVTAKAHTTTIDRFNTFLICCWKFANNYATRKKVFENTDMGVVCAGRTVKEGELITKYFRELANK